MSDDWKIAKDYLISYYFSNDIYMRSVAEEAYMGDSEKQEELARWFENHGMIDIAIMWKQKARLIRMEKEI